MAEWKQIYNSDKYVVSDEGEVARVDTGQILKQYQRHDGYMVVWLRHPYGCVATPVHRLVCAAFHGMEGLIKGMYVDHRDTNRANNRSDNLHWVTPRDNANNPLTLAKRRKR